MLRRNAPYGNIIYMLRLLENDRKTSFLMACSRLSDSGEDAKEKGTRKVPFYFRVCAFSIQRTRLSRSLQQATFLTDLFSRSRYMKRVQLFNGRYTKGVPFVKNSIFKGKGLDLGAKPLRTKLYWVASHPSPLPLLPRAFHKLLANFLATCSISSNFFRFKQLFA